MHRIVSQKVAEGEEYFDFLIGMQEDHVLPAIFHRAGRSCYTVPGQYHVLLEVNVNRMRPLPAFVTYCPDLGCALPRVGVDAVGIEDFAVDDPRAAEVIESQQPLLRN